MLSKATSKMNVKYGFLTTYVRTYLRQDRSGQRQAYPVVLARHQAVGLWGGGLGCRKYGGCELAAGTFLRAVPGCTGTR